MKMELPEIRPEERTPLVEALLAIIRELLDRNQQLEETVLQLRDEIAILKGQKPRPKIKPSSLESATPPSESSQKERPDKRPGSEKRSKNAELTIHRRVPLHIDDLPHGAVFKGYENYIVQELVIESQNTLYLRARYQLPDGSSVLAPLPANVIAGSHYGPTLTCYILHQYHNGLTQPLLLEQLHDFGIDISAGQLERMLTEGKEVFHQEKAEVLQVGLLVSSYIGADDTTARHQGHNGYSTVIGNDWFTYFESTSSKSRLNFLHVLQGRQRDYVVNQAACDYWKKYEIAAAIVVKLTQGRQHFSEETAWQAHLQELEITGERHVRVITEGALVGGLVSRGVSPDLNVLSDGAGQFVIFVHCSCWIHVERPLPRLVPHNEEHRAAIEAARQTTWEFYQELKAYKQQPDAEKKLVLEACFDARFEQRTPYPSINAVFQDIREHKADLLRVLDRPEVPLHNNGCESDIREYVKRRKISGGTRSGEGRRCRDTFTSLKKTCRKSGVNFWSYLLDRVRGLGQIPRLPDLIRQRAAESRAPNVQAVPG
jgi:transposase IS66 family protein